MRTSLPSGPMHHPTTKFTPGQLRKYHFFNTAALSGTNLYINPTDKHHYLRMDSGHPTHSKTSILLVKHCRYDESVQKIASIQRTPGLHSTSAHVEIMSSI